MHIIDKVFSCCGCRCCCSCDSCCCCSRKKDQLPSNNEQLLSKYKNFQCKSIDKNDEIPTGWHLATNTEVIDNKKQIDRTVNQWDTYGVKFQGGRFVKGRGSIFTDKFTEKCNFKLIVMDQ